MIQMFEGKKHKQDKKEQAPSSKPQIITPENEDMYAELKISKEVQKVMRPIPVPVLCRHFDFFNDVKPSNS